MDNHIEAVIDVDGVLADFEGYFCETFGDKNRNIVDLSKRYPKMKPKIVNFVRDKETYRYLDAIQLGLDIINWLHAQGVTIHIVSSRPLGTFTVTQNWLKSYHIPYSSLTVKADKVATIRSLQPSFIVDDIISVAEDVYQHLSIPAILVKHPWNETPFFPRVDSIDMFIFAYQYLMDARPVKQWR